MFTRDLYPHPHPQPRPLPASRDPRHLDILILNSVQEGDSFSAETIRKSRFHCQINWSGNGAAGKF